MSLREHVSLREHACVSSRGAQSTELVWILDFKQILLLLLLFSAVLSILMSRLLVYYAGSGVNRVQVVLSGFSMRLFNFVQAKIVCRYDCIYIVAALVLVRVNVMVMSSA